MAVVHYIERHKKITKSRNEFPQFCISDIGKIVFAYGIVGKNLWLGEDFH
jgi:hypothetical protein